MQVTCFLIFDKKTLILYAFMTTKIIQIYLYIGMASINYMTMFRKYLVYQRVFLI